MEKRNKKPDRPKLRKEDIGIPVNFVHVQHVGFGGQKSMSQSASPSTENSDPFFSQQSYRRSDTPMTGQVKPGKENRFSFSINSRHQAPYSSMSNLSNTGFDTSAKGLGKNAGVGKQKSGKTSFSGSLLNLNFFPFSKSSGHQERSSRNNNNGDNKRLSLTSVASHLPFSAMTISPPNSPVVQKESSRQFFRRRSSSFNGEWDVKVMGSSNKKPTPELSMMMTLNKKPKIVTHYSVSPPLSPSYDELPPPPMDLTFNPNPNPSYVELPSPPPNLDMEESSSKNIFSFGNDDGEFLPLPPPPSPPIFNPKKKLSTILYTPPFTPIPDDLPSSCSATPPPLPKSLPPPLKNVTGRVGYKKAPLQVFRVNAPTLPPLSIPLMRPKNVSPVETPLTWPLEPLPHPIQIPHLISGDEYDEKQNEQKGKTETYELANQMTRRLTIENVQEICNANSTAINQSHIQPLSKLFQCRLSYKQWPIMMNRLFANSSQVNNDPSFSQVYNDLIKSTLELWLKAEGGSASLENVVAAFENTQLELNQDSEEDFTKL